MSHIDRREIPDDDLTIAEQRWAETFEETWIRQEEENGRTSRAFAGDTTAGDTGA